MTLESIYQIWKKQRLRCNFWEDVYLQYNAMAMQCEPETDQFGEIWW